MSGKGAKGLSGKGLSGKGAKGTMKGGDKKKPTSRSVKAGLQFPVGRIHRFLKVSTACSRLRGIDVARCCELLASIVARTSKLSTWATRRFAHRRVARRVA